MSKDCTQEIQDCISNTIISLPNQRMTVGEIAQSGANIVSSTASNAAGGASIAGLTGAKGGAIVGFLAGLASEFSNASELVGSLLDTKELPEILNSRVLKYHNEDIVAVVSDLSELNPSVAETLRGISDSLIAGDYDEANARYDTLETIEFDNLPPEQQGLINQYFANLSVNYTLGDILNAYPNSEAVLLQAFDNLDPAVRQQFMWQMTALMPAGDVQQYMSNLEMVMPILDSIDDADMASLATINVGLVNLLGESASNNPYIDPSLFRGDHQAIFDFIATRTDELNQQLYGSGTIDDPANLTIDERAQMEAELAFLDEQFLLLDNARVDGASGFPNEYFAEWGEGQIPPEARLFWEAQQNPELVTEMMDNNMLAPLLQTIFTSDSAQSLIAEQLFSTQAGEDGVSVFDKAVEQAMVNMLYGDRLIPGSDSLYINEDGVATEVPQNPLWAMQQDMQGMAGQMGIMPVSALGEQAFDETGEVLDPVDVQTLKQKVESIETNIQSLQGDLAKAVTDIQLAVTRAKSAWNLASSAISKAGKCSCQPRNPAEADSDAGTPDYAK